MAFKTLDQCYSIQDILFKAVQKERDPQNIANLVRAWDSVVDRQRILRGKPLPAQLRPDQRVTRGKRRRPAAVAAAPVVTDVVTDMVTPAPAPDGDRPAE